ncbi:Rgp1-domain-containing protein [Xylaria bambusicola]|uniref:Rgp1-domain-containing protein n=1 Tax=Xylaria bambusicola TaxID=326684 RepID=UPI0020087548|nr:Rgp1-domain-containing protein [Xylaria bambusicola]KAI0506606.1 Rgp1-domain-containing protein [Xylaria bambusicola]
MSPEARATNIRVFIKWDDQTVFAGEELRCHITFKNVAPGPASASNQRQSLQPSPRSDRSRQPSPLLSPRAGSTNGLTPPPSARSHRSTLSLNVPSTGSRLRNSVQQWPPPQLPQPPPPQRPNHAHKRSLSIVSMGSSATVDDQAYTNGTQTHPQRPSRGHGRSASLQIVPRTGTTMNGPQSAALPRRPPFGSEPSPVFNNHSFPPSKHALGQRSGVTTAPNTPGFTKSPTRRKASGPIPDFRFPMASGPPSGSVGNTPGTYLDDSTTTPTAETAPQVSLPVRSKEPIPIISEHSAPIARVLATTSIAEGTPRSSGEFYSMSNNSSETLASEYVIHPFQGGRRPAHLRRSSGISGISMARMPESLMMGYAQVQGSFTLDGSLVNLGPFEAVKRKAVLGGQGGGVIGVESSRRSSGFLNGFGWGGLGNSIGELLGASEFSSIKDMRGAANSKSIPLLSTPQSILFVDLQLGPGESKTYEYSFRLPKGLPPTHRGKAIKIAYSLVVGTQRAGGAKEQQVRSVDTPFRVLGSVNSYGEILGHDLLSPYILLRDQAKVQPHEKGFNTSTFKKRTKTEAPASTINDFLTYVDELLDRPRDGMSLLSPTATAAPSRRSSSVGEPTNAKQAIDLAIIRSNLSSDSGQSSNRFVIARNGQRVGVIMLARPSYRLGETISMAIDFTDAEVPCYAIHAALETSERIDPSLALRSDASVHRVTRKVHASSSEATLFARRVVFSPTIPITATPEFVTSGLNFEWKIRVEFVVPSSTSTSGMNSADDPDDQESPREGEQSGGGHPLLEEISHNDKAGLVLVAAETLECESFEVAVPLRVYGAVCNGLERLERDEALEEGLVV